MNVLLIHILKMLLRICTALLIFQYFCNGEITGLLKEVLINGYNFTRIGVYNISLCGGEENFNLKMGQARVGKEGLSFGGILDLFIDVDNDNTVKVVIDRILPNDKVRPLLTIKQKGGCDAVMKYGGELYKGIAKAANVPHYDKCPIPKGTYKLDWYTLELGKISLLKLVPNGRFKASLEVHEQGTNKMLLCGSGVGYKNM